MMQNQNCAGPQGRSGMSCQQPQQMRGNTGNCQQPQQTRGNAGAAQMQMRGNGANAQMNMRNGSYGQMQQGNSAARMVQETQRNSSCNTGGLSRQQLMKRVMLAGFACVDASLYLDTHPDDAEALSYFKEHNRIYQEAVEEYSKTYGPLTIAHAHHCDAYWNWVNQPWPWQ